MIEPVAWIGQDAFAALLGGETICQTMTPSQAMYDDVPLTVIPPGYAIVPVEQVKDAERYRWLRDIGDSTWAPMGARVPEGSAGIDAAIDKAMLTAAKGE